MIKEVFTASFIFAVKESDNEKFVDIIKYEYVNQCRKNTFLLYGMFS